MKLTVFLSLILTGFSCSPARAGSPTAPAGGNNSLDEQDKSGTNPTLLLRSVSLGNEYDDLASGDYLDILTFKYTEPFMDGKMSLRLSAPYKWTDLGHGDDGLGDISLKWTWVAKATKQEGWVFNTELYAPTGDGLLSTNQWVLAPGVTYARFLSREIIVAPAYVHNIGFAADRGAADISAGAFDLYMVYRPQGKSWWLTADLTLGMNYDDTDVTPMSFELQYGWKAGKVGNAALNAFIRPGIGFGDDRPYDWNLEAGVTLIGF